jgi:hypothetical protein
VLKAECARGVFSLSIDDAIADIRRPSNRTSPREEGYKLNLVVVPQASMWKITGYIIVHIYKAK